jgi:hypothetical protein
MSKSTTQAVSSVAKATPAAESVLQRKCDCGNHTVSGGQCEACGRQKNNQGSFLSGTLSSDSNALEREADNFADSIDDPAKRPRTLTLGAATRLSASVNPLLQATIQAGVSTPGEAVPRGTLSRVAPELADAGNIRIHRNQVANASARLAGAHAYAYGSHIVLGPQARDIDSSSGRRTFAHEFAHVGQQTGFRSESSSPRPQFSLQTYIRAMNQRPEPDWRTAAEHLNGETPETIKVILKNLSPQYRAKLHEAARDWPGLCSNVARLTEADYLKEHPETTTRIADSCTQKQPAAAPAAAPPSQGKGSMAPAPKRAASTELTEQDAATCSPLYLQKLCVYIVGGFNGDRSGVETPEEMAGYNETCRLESGYDGTAIELTDEDKVALRTPRCPRGDPAAARERARAAKVTEALKRSVKYMPGGIGEELLHIITDPIFLGSLALAIGVYLALWLAPEPVFSKIAAAATTLAILGTGAFSISTLYNLAQAWTTLEADADAAQSDAEIERAAEKFGKRMGAVEADLLVFLASLLVGGRVPGPKRMPPATQALSEAEAALAATPKQGGVLIEGNFGRARIVSPPNEPPVAFSGSNPLKIEPATMPEPARVYPFPTPKAPPAPVAAKGAAPAPAVGTKPDIAVVPHLGAHEDPESKKRPPFILKLPRQKAPHLATYRAWLGALQSDPNYHRGDPPQLTEWHKALRLGGSHGIPAEVYERGHSLGLIGVEGERRIRVPDWSLTIKPPGVAMEVDHIVELQVTPPHMRDEFNKMDNFELLERTANGASGNLLRKNIDDERAKQKAFDPDSEFRVLIFDAVELDGGSDGERWSHEDIRAGEQLDAFEEHK